MRSMINVQGGVRFGTSAHCCTLRQLRTRAGTAVSATRQRGNSEDSNPFRRADGRWQVHIRHTDEDGSSSRHTVYGSTAKEARDRPWRLGLACVPTCQQRIQDHPR